MDFGSGMTHIGKFALLLALATIPRTAVAVCTNGEAQLWTNDPPMYEGRIGEQVKNLTGTRLWPDNKIPFTIDGDYTQRERQALTQVLERIHENTCIRFVPNKDCELSEYVHASRRSVFTFDIGYTGRRQTTGLAWRNLRDISQSAHQLFHVLGFNHEEQRPDAPRHVSGPFSSCGVGGVTPATYINTLDDFDYSTIMLRLGYFGSCPSDVRARDAPIQENTVRMLGSKDGPSQLDFRKINLAYGCVDLL